MTRRTRELGNSEFGHQTSVHVHVQVIHRGPWPCGGNNKFVVVLAISLWLRFRSPYDMASSTSCCSISAPKRSGIRPRDCLWCALISDPVPTELANILPNPKSGPIWISIVSKPLESGRGWSKLDPDWATFDQVRPGFARHRPSIRSATVCRVRPHSARLIQPKRVALCRLPSASARPRQRRRHVSCYRGGRVRRLRLARLRRGDLRARSRGPPGGAVAARAGAPAVPCSAEAREG